MGDLRKVREGGNYRAVESRELGVNISFTHVEFISAYIML